MINTSRIIENTLNNIITGIVIFSIPVIYSAIIGFIYKVSIVEVMHSIPIYTYLTLFILFILWGTRKYIKKKMNEGISGAGVSTYQNYEDIDNINYNNLLWIVQVKNSSFRHAQYYGDTHENEAFNDVIKNIRIKSSPPLLKMRSRIIFYTT